MPPLSNKPNYRMPWAEADDEQLKAMLALGEGIPAIAKCLGRSQEAVRNRAWKRGILTSVQGDP